MFVSIELGAFVVRSSCNLFLFLHLCSVHLFPIELLSGYHVEGSISLFEVRDGDGKPEPRGCSRPCSMCGLVCGDPDFSVVSRT